VRDPAPRLVMLEVHPSGIAGKCFFGEILNTLVADALTVGNENKEIYMESAVRNSDFTTNKSDVVHEAESILLVADAAKSGSIESETKEPDALDRAITTKWLLKFSLPTILATLVMNAFGMVDGVFAARLINPVAFAATGMVWPFISLAMAVGFMLSMGGSAVVAKKLGEGKVKEARADFTTLTLVTFIVSVVLAVWGLLFPETLMNILGVDEIVRPMAAQYLQPLLIMLPFAMVGFYIQQFFITDGKPSLGFILTLAGGLVSVGLNFLLIWHLGWELRGAAIATGLGQSIPALVGVIYFMRNRNGLLRFGRPTWDLKMLGHASLNGASEMVTMLAASITFVVMNNILIRLVGYEGVAAVSIMMVGQMLVASTFLGYAWGIAPIIGYNYGKQDRERLQRLFKRSIGIIMAGVVLSIIVGWFLASPLTMIYVPRSTNIYQMAVVAFRFGLIGFLFMGINVFASTMFTALSNGIVSGLLALLRTLVFILFMLSLLPAILDVNGVWLALPAAELLAFGTTLFFFWKMRAKYGYY